MTFFIQNDNSIDDMDINTSALTGAITIRCGYSQPTELSAAIGLVPMTKKYFPQKWKSFIKMGK